MEEAWARVRSEVGWVPAWQAWSKQVVRPGGQDGRLNIVLVPPMVAEEEEGNTLEQAVWEEEDLETFLQQCELEAGLIAETDADEIRRRGGGIGGRWKRRRRWQGLAAPGSRSKRARMQGR